MLMDLSGNHSLLYQQTEELCILFLTGVAAQDEGTSG
jgi:hypothetical protein